MFTLWEVRFCNNWAEVDTNSLDFYSVYLQSHLLPKFSSLSYLTNTHIYISIMHKKTDANAEIE